METKIGEVIHYYTNIGVGVMNLTDGPLAVGDSIHISGHSTNLSQVVEEMQVDHSNVEKVETGSEVAVKLDDKVRKGDEVYRVTMKDE